MSQFSGRSVLLGVAVGDNNFIRVEISGGYVRQRVRMALAKKIGRLLEASGPLDVDKELGDAGAVGGKKKSKRRS